MPVGYEHQATIRTIAPCRRYLEFVLDSARTVMPERDFALLVPIERWLRTSPAVPSEPIPYNVSLELPSDPDEWLLAFRRLTNVVVRLLSDSPLGPNGTIRMFQLGLKQLWLQYADQGVLVAALELLPGHVLDPTRFDWLDPEVWQLLYLRTSDRLATASEELVAKTEDLRSKQLELARANVSRREVTGELQAVLDASGEGLLTVDLKGQILLANRTAELIWGVEQKALTGITLERLLPDLGLTLQQTANQATRRERLNQLLGRTLQLRGSRSDGSTLHLEVRVAKAEPGDTSRFAVSVRPVNERIRVLGHSRARDGKNALAVWGAHDGVWDWDITNGSVEYSDRWKEMLNLTTFDVGKSPWEWFGRIHPHDSNRVRLELESHLRGETARFESEHRLRLSDGRYRWMLMRGTAVRDENGAPTRLTGLLTDLTDRKLIDPLTGLPNRVMFVDRLSQAMIRTQTDEEFDFALLFVDLDRFKVVNDSFGHQAGDRLLVAVARRLESCVRPMDTVARMGGDEFAILLSGVDEEKHSRQVSDRILAELGSVIHLNQGQVTTSASIGIVTGGAAYETPDEVLLDADRAMYRAKAQGKARYEVFNATMRDGQSRLETDLRWALGRRQLELWYQPIVSVTSGSVVGFEALLRWRHPEEGLVGPGRFIHLAEETGLIVPIGRWALNQACRQIKAWGESFPHIGHLSVHVNVSPKQLRAGFGSELHDAIEANGLQHDQIKLEITESLLVDTDAAVEAALENLRTSEVQISVDDFGTGYSSLSRLHRLPIDTIKIDRSFVSAIETGPDRLDVIQAIVALARAFRLRVIAEGVETEWQLHQLESAGCDFWQGYLAAKPMHPDDIEDFMGWKDHSTGPINPVFGTPQYALDFVRGREPVADDPELGSDQTGHEAALQSAKSRDNGH